MVKIDLCRIIYISYYFLLGINEILYGIIYLCADFGKQR